MAAPSFSAVVHWAPTGSRPICTPGAAIGLVGLGLIGREVALRLRGFQSEVTYFSRRRLSPEDEKALGTQYLGFAELLLLGGIHHRGAVDVHHR